MASNYRRPGTFVEEVLLPQQISALGLDVSVGAFAGRTERGPVNTPTFVSSWTEYARQFGGFKDSSGSPYWTTYAVYQFFGNGGRGCYVSRVAASDSLAARVTLNDGTATPQDVLVVSAASAGDWAIASPNGSGISVQVLDSTPRFNLASYRVDNGVVTLTTNIAHNFLVGDVINVGGFTTTGVSGEYTVTGVTTTTLTYSSAASNAGDTTPSTGSFVSSANEVFSLAVFYNGITNGYLVEKYNDISLNPASDRYALSLVNASSKYVALSRPTGFIAPTSGTKSIYRSPAASNVPVGLSKPTTVTNLSSVSVTGASISGTGVATLTASGHALQVNDVVTLSGVNITAPNTGLPGSSSLNGTYTVTAVNGSTSFNFNKVIQSNLNAKITLTSGGVIGTSSAHGFRVNDQITIAGTSDSNFDTTARTLTAVTQSSTAVAVTGSSVTGASNSITVASGDIAKFWVGQPVTATRSAGTSALNSNSYVMSATTTTVNISSIAFSSGTSTYTTAAAHNLFVGAQVVIASTTNTANSGSFTVLTVPTTTTFTVSNASGVAQASAAGTCSSYVVALNANAIIDATVGSVATTTLAPAMQFGTTLTSPSGYAVLSGPTATYTLASQTGLTGSVTGVRTVTTSGSLEGSGITKTDLIVAADDFDSIGNNLIYNVPDAASLGSSDCRAVNAAFIAVADTRGDSFVVVDTPQGLDATSAQSYSADVTPKSNNAAIYYPWVNIADPTQSGTPATRAVPPGGSVVGLILQTDASRGVFKAPAGLGANLSNVISAERAFSSSDLDALNTALTPINVIRQVPGAGICVMGARNVGADRRMKYVSTRRTMLQIKKRLSDLTAFAVFEPNDERLWEQVRNICGTYLRELWQQGGLKGATQPDAYFVKCDATNNTATSRADGELNIEVGVALQTPAEFVIIRIGQFDGATSINVQ